ncbi:MAG: RNA-binding domain-containing protein [Candidatus Thorarchaeota archaeon]|jgi:predicted RNA binding protein with dsRBD fold (UPF0201 family)
MDIFVRCPVNPTEDVLKVKRALENIIGLQTFTSEKHDEISELVLTDLKQESLNLVRQTIHELRIIDAARKRLLSNWNDTSTQIHFDKQAAFVGKLKIIDDSIELPPLGTIEIGLIFENESQFEEFLHWFAPRTKKGRAIS